MDKGPILIKNGSNVSVHYTLTVDGQVAESSYGKQPLSYVHGQTQMISGFVKNLEGMKKGDKKVFQVSANEAYGERTPDAVQTVPITSFSDPKSLKVGGVVEGSGDGQQFKAVILEIKEDEIVLDLNHPLAGKDLQFEVEVVEIL